MWRKVAHLLIPLQSHRDGKCSFFAHRCHISVRIGSLSGLPYEGRLGNVGPFFLGIFSKYNLSSAWLQTLNTKSKFLPADVTEGGRATHCDIFCICLYNSVI